VIIPWKKWAKNLGVYGDTPLPATPIPVIMEVYIPQILLSFNPGSKIPLLGQITRNFPGIRWIAYKTKLY